MKPTLLLDCDGCICDCATPVHRFAQKIFRRPLPGPETWLSYDHAEAMQLTPEEAFDFHREIKRSDVAFEIKFYEGAEEKVHQLKEAFDVCFVTSQWSFYPGWCAAREHLLEPLGCDLVFTHQKHRVHGQYLVDDRADTIERGSRHWKGVLFRRPWNSHLEWDTTVNSLEEVLKLV